MDKAQNLALSDSGALQHALKPENMMDGLVFSDKLVEIWEMEGFVKVEVMKSVEDVTDMTRELCMREAQNMNIVIVKRDHNDQRPCV
ncbi:hypothetical protein CQW23_06722 [Capsicum baccatum]|uniref:Uncharacterized protein n=1 Tax=Capsicum baccatum TaxID=33114 RepID=A0A2G2X477_CAPBA|nr:hypothetical protein CQW23_06722 [Capsicum baccatum]